MENEKIINSLVNTNEKRYNMEKAVEELLELAEVLMKKVLKAGGPKEPSDQEVIDEIGDVMIRVEVLARIFDEDKVYDRVEFKLSKFAQYMEEGKYVGGI